MVGGCEASSARIAPDLASRGYGFKCDCENLARVARCSCSIEAADPHGPLLALTRTGVFVCGFFYGTMPVYPPKCFILLISVRNIYLPDNARALNEAGYA